ncbi:hypothetical protein Lepto7376_3728 [[Leptolyngbya] sp. PCC 7376]|nr:hypothetical protein Lepto7376_3728 [[Leptolyngbya] sp. PCC 7376]
MYLEITAGEFEGWIGWCKYYDFASDGKTKVFITHVYDSQGKYHDIVLIPEGWIKWLGL